MWASRWRRGLVRVVALYHLAGLLAVLATAPAHAQPAGTATGGVPENAVFSWMEVKDSHGISVWSYFMSLDHGNARHPWKAVFAVFIEIEWEIYRALAASTIWILTYALRFEWLAQLVEPARSIGASITAMTGQLNLTGVLLTAAALVAGCWMLRGRWSTGIYEIAASCLIATLAVSMLSDPVDRVAGPDGLIISARDIGLELAAGLTHSGNTTADPDQLLDDLSTSLADTLLRRPAQLINFGQIIDDLGPEGQACIEAWDRGFDKVKGNTRDTLKDNIRSCEGGGDNWWDSNGGSMKAYADDPNATQVAAAGALIIGGLVLMCFGWCLAFTVLAAVCAALYQSIKAIPGLLLGIAPGAPRGMLLKTAANLAMALVSLVFAVVFVAGYMLVIRDFFSTGSDNLFKKVFIVDIVLVAGLILFRRGVRTIRAYADTLATKMATRPGAAPTHIQRPVPHANALQAAYYTAQMSGQAIRMGSRAAGGIQRYAAGQKASAMAGVGSLAATVTSVATGGASAAAWVATKAAGGAAVMAAAGTKSATPPPPTPPTSSTSTGSRSTTAPPVAVGSPAAAKPRRPRPEDVYKPGIKRRVGVAMPVTPGLHRPAAAPATEPARPAAPATSARGDYRQRVPSGLWVPARGTAATAPAARTPTRMASSTRTAPPPRAPRP
ncbi:hypothetical protein Ntsu_79180 [Nocardia sp. IFM 10818]